MSQHHTEKEQNRQLASGVFLVWKYRGETLAVLIKRFRLQEHIDASVPITYAGRLDPMADGLVLLLAGDARFKKDSLLGLEKTYEVTVLLGVSSDTLDPLGIIQDTSFKAVAPDAIEFAIADMKNLTKLPYPLYSSVPVAGKPLYMHARAGTEVIRPEKNIHIYEANLVATQNALLGEVVGEIFDSIQKVRGDFRQEEILEKWQEVLVAHPSQEVQLVTLQVRASSGTYMRSLAEWFGKRVGIPAIAYKIRRDSIGKYQK